MIHARRLPSIDMKSLSIKTKVTVLATASCLALLVIVSVALMQYVKVDMRELLGAQQLSLVARVADDIEENVALSHGALIAAAQALSPHALGDDRQLEETLSRSVSLTALFDQLSIASAAGKILVDVPHSGLAGAYIGDRPDFLATLHDGKPKISPPHMGLLLHVPIVVMTAPVVDQHGHVVAVLIGALNLLSSNFLGRLAEAKVGRTGGFTLLTRDRTIVVSDDKSHILSTGPAPGVSPFFDRAVAGESGWEEGVDSHGLHALFSYKPLHSVPLVLIAALPVEEAYVPIMHAQRRVFAVTAFMACVLAPLIWLGTRSFLAPLVNLRDTIRRLRSEPDTKRAVPIRRRDELGDLASDFNDMMHERQQAEQALREKEARLQAFMKNSPSVMFIKDTEGRYVQINEQFRRSFGIRPEDILSRTDAEIFPDEEAAAFQANDRHVLETGAPLEVEETAEYIDGAHTSIVAKFPIHDADGKIVGLGGIATDITARLRAENRFRALLEAAPDAIVVVDAAGKIIVINSQLERLFGHKRQSVIGSSLEMLVPERFRKSHLAQRDAFLRHPHARPMGGAGLELYGLRSDGGEFPVEISLSPPLDTEQGVLITAAIRDITDRKAAERQIKASLEEKEVLLREIHHRVKNNMQIVSSLLQLQCAYVEDVKAREIFEESQIRIRTLALVHEKLYQSPDLTMVDFSEYTRSVASMLSLSYGSRDTRLQIAVQAEPVLLSVDRAMPAGLIMNELVTNSIKHAFPNGHGGIISVALTGGTEDIVLEVGDTGVGLPQGFCIGEGGSLGLRLVRILATQLGGTIDWRNGGAGAHFTLTFKNHGDLHI